MEESRKRIAKMIAKIRKWSARISFVLFAGSVIAVLFFRSAPIYITPLMLIRTCEQWSGNRPLKLEHRWVPLSQIARPLAQAVIASEDNRFLTHHGFDLEQITQARKEADRGRRLRGASTISQQTAKNIFLWPGKSYFRKGLEAYFTILIELLWSKERIMEVYLNSIEMGDGIYGAEAVARAHFHKPAAKLAPAEAALVAASLPNPRKLHSNNPSAYLLKRQSQILSLMNKIGTINLGCL
jgi:monofunctional biosynthetic peptidoglycan transglycosylase